MRREERQEAVQRNKQIRIPVRDVDLHAHNFNLASVSWLIAASRGNADVCLAHQQSRGEARLRHCATVHLAMRVAHLAWGYEVRAPRMRIVVSSLSGSGIARARCEQTRVVPICLSS